MEPLQIYFETNPNPNSMKFVTNRTLVPEGSVDFTAPSEAESCPMALDLFRFNFVKRVFMTANFLTVTKTDDIDWIEVQEMVRSVMKAYMEKGEPLFRSMPKVDQFAPSGDEPEVITKIKVILDEYIRPAVEQDGGAIHFHSFDSGIVKVQLQGSCSGCPSSTVTLKAGIENLLKRMVPEVTEVVAEGV